MIINSNLMDANTSLILIEHLLCSKQYAKHREESKKSNIRMLFSQVPWFSGEDTPMCPFCHASNIFRAYEEDGNICNAMHDVEPYNRFVNTVLRTLREGRD